MLTEKKDREFEEQWGEGEEEDDGDNGEKVEEDVRDQMEESDREKEDNGGDKEDDMDFSGLDLNGYQFPLSLEHPCVHLLEKSMLRHLFLGFWFMIFFT